MQFEPFSRLSGDIECKIDYGTPQLSKAGLPSSVKAPQNEGELFQYCMDLMPQLEVRIDKFLTDHYPSRWANEKKADGVLRSAGVCEIASHVLGELLVQDGLKVSVASVLGLQEMGPYPLN